MRIASALVLLLALNAPFVSMGDDDRHMIRFYAGEVLRAEIKADDGSIKIVNVNKFAPKSRVTSDVGYAVVTVRLDNGRSLGIYDYSLVSTRRDVFPCVAIMNDVGEYDASLRELLDTKPNQLYNLLFRVEMPLPEEKPAYLLRFNLVKGKHRDPFLLFVDVSGHPFTKTSKIPLEGMLGVVPDWPKPKPKPKPKPEPKKTPEAAKKKEPAASKDKKADAKGRSPKKAPAPKPKK